MLQYIKSTILPSKPAQLLLQIGTKWNQDNCPGLAASLSYFALFSLFPMLLVVLSVIGAWIRPNTEASQYIQEAIGIFLKQGLSSFDPE
jgi:membrane protein